MNANGICISGQFILLCSLAQCPKTCVDSTNTIY